MINKGPSVLVIGGTGKNGQQAVLHLAHNPKIKKIFVAGRNPDAAHTIISNAVMTTSLLERFPQIEFVPLDLTKQENTVDVLKRINPDMVLQTATGISSFWYVPIIKKAIKTAGLSSYHPGHTVAKDLAMIYLSMKAMQDAELSCPVVNLSFPDHTCYILGQIGLAPNCGAGSIAMTVLSSKIVVSKLKQVPLNDVRITMIAHHALRAYDPTEVPYYMKIYAGEEDITDQLDTDSIIRECMKYTLFKTGNTAHSIAASAVNNLLKIYFDSGAFGHCPGPEGLCGGYPVTFTRDAVTPILPPGVTKSQAEEMNAMGMKKDGIEKVDQDGTVHFGEGPRSVLEGILGLSGWRTMKVTECVDMMNDLVTGYQQLANKQDI